MTEQERIAELERRVSELERRLVTQPERLYPGYPGPLADPHNDLMPTPNRIWYSADDRMS